MTTISKKKKNTTLNDLAVIMQTGFVKVEKNTDKKIDNLAGMVQRGFLAVDKRFEGVDKQIRESEERIKGEINNRIDDLELKMSSWISIYRIDIEALDKKINNVIERVGDLEFKVGLKSK